MAQIAFEQLDLTAPVIAAPDGSEIWLMTRIDGASSIHMRLDAGLTSRAQRHATVSELWFFVQGAGEFWREGDGPRAVSVGSTLNVPVGTGFQFRNTGTEPLRAWIATSPPWPQDDAAETIPIEGLWTPTV